MTQHDFEANLESLFAKPPKFDDDQEFESRLARRFEQTHVRRIALLWIFGALGVFSSCYLIGLENLLTVLNDSFDLLFAATDGLPFHMFALIASIVAAAMHRAGSHRTRL